MPNPLTDVICFRMEGASFDLANLESIKDRYSKGHPEVISIYYQEGMIESIVSNLDKISYIFLIAGAVLSLLAFMLIYNSIRLSIYANRFLIRNMELVGASWSFIRKPFLTKSVVHGFVSAVLAIGALAGAYFVTSLRLPEIMQYLKEENILYLISIILIAGVVINLASTWVVVTRFLGMSSNDLHQ
jgi:cell division transport system permease protein